MKDISPEQKLQHLFWRAGFGPDAHSSQDNRKVRKAVHTLLQDAKGVNLLQVPMPDSVEGMGSMQNAEERRRRQRERRQAFEQMNHAWLQQMATAKGQLREKMTYFWHGHFACRLRDPRLAQVQHNTLRQHALGKFPELLLAISKDPGMLQFLNNQQNRKQKPNENFAREVLELFTLGRGYYSEQDIKEAARAFTGWGYNAKGEFIFRERLHDKGKKTFMGQSGRFKGEDILEIIVADPRTAEFLTEKLYTFFVSDVPNAHRIQELSTYFYQSGYDIAGLLEEIFTANWFYSPDVIGSKIKSPIELLVGLQRQFHVTYADTKSPLVLQRALGQELFQPPNVSGWKGGRNWIDSSTLAYRLRIGPALLEDTALEISLKPDDDAEPSKPVSRRKDGLRIARAKANMDEVLQAMDKVKKRDLAKELSEKLLQVRLSPAALHMLEQSIGSAKSKEETIRLLTLRLLSLPEYQLC